jgi:hypothetical protein
MVTVRGIVPRSRAIARVDKPSAAISTIRARNTWLLARRRPKPSLELRTLAGPLSDQETCLTTKQESAPRESGY